MKFLVNNNFFFFFFLNIPWPKHLLLEQPVSNENHPTIYSISYNIFVKKKKITWNFWNLFYHLYWAWTLLFILLLLLKKNGNNNNNKTILLSYHEMNKNSKMKKKKRQSILFFVIRIVPHSLYIQFIFFFGIWFES